MCVGPFPRHGDRPSLGRLGRPAIGHSQVPLGRKRNQVSATVLWVIAAILVIVGIVQLLQGQIIFGVVLIVVGCLVGPGGYSIFRNRQVGS